MAKTQDVARGLVATRLPAASHGDDDTRRGDAGTYSLATWSVSGAVTSLHALLSCALTSSLTSLL